MEKGQIIENMSHRKIVNYDHTLQTTAGKLPFTFKERFTHLLPVLKMTTYLIRQAQTPYAPPSPPSRKHVSYFYAQHFRDRVWFCRVEFNLCRYFSCLFISVSVLGAVMVVIAW